MPRDVIASAEQVTPGWLTAVILVSIFIPVWRWAVFRWAPDLAAVARSMMAFDDLGCSELLQEHSTRR